MINMDKRLKSGLGVIFCILGVLIIVSNLFYMIVIPGGLFSILVGAMLIYDSIRK
jgi:hypothetical protein